MKKIFAVITLLAGAVTGFSQGQVDWGDYDNIDFQITVWSPQTGAAEFTEVQGNSPADFGTGLLMTGPDIPSGAQIAYTGVPLGGSVTGPNSPTNYGNGNLWSVQLFAAPGADVPAYLLAPVPGAVAKLSTIAADQGLYEAMGDFALEIPGVAPDGIVTLQLRAWYNGNDAYPNYTAALNAGQPAGQSTTGSETIGGDEFVPPDLPGPGNLGVSGGITSFSLVVPSGASNLIDVAFTGAAATAKTGFAATGATPNDLWNTYVMNAGSLPNLEFADGTASGAGLTIANASEAATNGATDPMYGSYLYTNGANMTLTVTNLSQGVYDFYLYGHGNENDENSVFQLVSGGQSYGSEATTNGPGWLSSEWQEGVQYVRFAGVSVSSGQAITVTVEPGAGGYAVLAGLQMMQVGPMPVFIFQPTNQTIIEGSNATFSVVASGATPLAYQWLFNNAIISGATNSAYGITGAQLADIGNYSVTVTNSYGSVTSLVATLDVIGPVAALIDVAFTDGAVTGKTGFAATGVTMNDFWNTFDTYPGSLSDLEFVDGTLSAAELTIANPITGSDQNGAPDPMYGTYVFAYNISMTLTNLPAGSYDFYLYGHGKENDQNSVFQLSVGSENYKRATINGSGWLSPVWQEGVQYVEFTNVNISPGEIVTITIEPGTAPNYATLAGLQIANSALYPIIVTQPASQALVAGTSANFRVVADGVGPLGYQWLFNNVVIPNATNSSYTLAEVVSADAGDYSVRVSNPYGAITSQIATMTVSNILILAQPTSQLVYAGTSANFSVLATAGTPLAYQWLFDNAAISAATNSSYTIPETFSADAGNYSVIVSNAFGSVVSEVASLTVLNILILTQPANQSVDAGASVTFNVVATAGTPLVYQWLFNNAAIAGATNSSYSLEEALPDDAGSYSVVVTNGFGNLSSQIVTLVVSNISIITQPAGQSVFQGQSVTFNIVATAVTPLSYQWCFNNATIPGATSSSYSLASAQPANAGDYSVVLSDSYGSVTSQVATLTIDRYLGGQVDWGDYFNDDFQITIWSPQTGAAEFTEVQGNSPADFGTGLLMTGPDIPPGTQTAYTGVPLGGSVTGPSSPTNYANGNLWSVQLFAAPGADVPAYLLAPVPGAVANLSTMAADQGLYEATGDTAVEIPGVFPDGTVTLQLRAWYNGHDAYPNYTAALNAGQPAGQSTTGSETIGGDEFVPPDLPGPGNLGVSGGITSFSLVMPSGASNLIDVALTSAAATPKTGFAATGATPNDLWNTYVLNAGSLPNLEFADGTASGAGLAIANAGEAGTNGAADPMYGSYLYANGANLTVTVTNLNQGVYDFYLYGHGNKNDENSVFQLLSGAQSYGSEATTNGPGWLSSEWQEGVQYVRFAGVRVSSGQAIAITVEPGAGGYAVLAGLQMMQVGPMPIFIVQPTNQTIIEGSNTTFSVVASGDQPLAYQWLFYNVDIPGATNSSYGITDAQLTDIGNYSVIVTNAYGSVTSLVATLNVIAPIAALIDVAFTDGAVTSKTGFAATGVSINDFWNTYDMYPGSLSDLEFADGTMSGAELTIAQTIASAGQNGSPDPMYGSYVTENFIAMTLTNLPAGAYDFYLYGHGPQNNQNSVFQLELGPNIYGTKATTTNSGWLSPVWQDGVQYVEFTDVTISAGQLVTIVVEPGGAANHAVLSGLQIVNSGLYPIIVEPPLNQELVAGASANFSVVADGIGPLGYRWLSNNVVISGATNSSYTLTDVPTSDAGEYSVLVSNPYGAVTSQVATLTVSNIVILTQPTSQSVYQGTSANFSVLATAGTPLAYQWLFNNAAISDATNSSYTLSEALPANAGNYSVIVSNAFGSVVSQVASLAVVNILILTQPTSQSVDAGATVTFNVVAASGTSLGYQWLFNNSAIAGATNSSYILAEVLSADAGNYSVIVSNVYGSLASQVAILTVSNISIIAQPIGQSVFQGQPVTFNIVATGLMPLAYQWLFNNVAIPGATNSSYNLASAHPADAGDYAVVLSDSFGSLTSQVAPLTVTNIVILTQPKSQFAFPGESATFSISAIAGTPLAYQWSFNNAVIAGATNTSYTVTSAEPGTFGNYSVLVFNLYGSVTSAVAALTLAPPLIDVAFTGASITGKTGFAAEGVSSNDFWNTYDVVTTSDLRNLKFVEGTASGVGLAEAGVYSLYNNGSPDPMYGIYAYASGNIILTVTNLPSGDNDFYLYGHGNADNQNGVYQLMAGSQNYGTAATTNGPGWLSTVWQEGVQYVVFRDVSVQAGQTVVITVEPGDGGDAVLSGLQIAPSSPLPNIAIQPQSQEIDPGANATFSVVAGGDAPLVYQWVFDHSDIPGATNSSYSVTNAQHADDGQYSVVVTNTYGSVTSQVATLTVIDIVIISQPQSQLAYQGAAATLSLEASSTAPLAYQWLFNNADIPDATNSSYSLGNVQPADAGNYFVVLTNIYGSLTSQVAALTVTNISIVTQPTNQVLFLGETALIDVVANAGMPLAYQWFFNSAEISGATNSSYSVPDAQPANSGNYFVILTNVYGSVTSMVATLTVLNSSTPGSIINVAFTDGKATSKTGLAAAGGTSNDFWNTCAASLYPGPDYGTGAAPGLKFVDGSASGAGMTIAGVDSFYGNGVPDPMYGVYLVNADRAITVTITNLLPGDFDFYLYGHGMTGQNGVFQLTVGSMSYGTEGTTTGAGWDSTVWQEGVQYVLFDNVIVAAGQTVTITAEPGSSGYSMIAGLQIAVPPSGTPQITSPASIVVGGGRVEVRVGSTVVQAGRGASVPVTVLSSVGLTNLSFTLTSPAGLLRNWTVHSTNSAIGTATVGKANTSEPQFAFAVQSGQVLQGSSVIGSICLDTRKGDSAFVPLVVTNLCAMEEGNSVATNLLAQNGRVTVIGLQPLLDATLDTDLNPMLTLYGHPGLSYALLSTTNLMDRGSWSTVGNFTLTGLFQGINLTGASNQMQFFRAVQY